MARRFRPSKKSIKSLPEGSVQKFEAGEKINIPIKRPATPPNPAVVNARRRTAALKKELERVKAGEEAATARAETLQRQVDNTAEALSQTQGRVIDVRRGAGRQMSTSSKQIRKQNQQIRQLESELKPHRLREARQSLVDTFARRVEQRAPIELEAAKAELARQEAIQRASHRQAILLDVDRRIHDRRHADIQNAFDDFFFAERVYGKERANSFHDPELRKFYETASDDELEYLVWVEQKDRLGAGGKQHIDDLERRIKAKGDDRWKLVQNADAARRKYDDFSTAFADLKNAPKPTRPTIDTKAWGDAVRGTFDTGKALVSGLWKYGLKKPGGYMIHHPRRTMATLATGGAGSLGYAYYLGAKQAAETSQEVANIKANMEDARQKFGDFTDDPGDLSWINNIPSVSSEESAAKVLVGQIDEIQKQMKERYKGFSSGAVDGETLRKVWNLWAKYDKAGENTNANRWRNMKETLSRYHPEYYTLLAGKPEERAKEQAKIFHEIDDAVNAQAAQAGGGK